MRVAKGEELGHETSHKGRSWGGWCGHSQAIWGGLCGTLDLVGVARGRRRQRQKRAMFSGGGVRQRWALGQCGRNNMVFCSHFEFVC